MSLSFVIVVSISNLNMNMYVKCLSDVCYNEVLSDLVVGKFGN